MIVDITSKENEKIKYTKSLLKNKKRNEEKKYVVEGYRILKQALESNSDVEYIIFSDEFLNKDNQKDFVYFLGDNNFKIYKITQKLFREITDTENPQGIIAVIKQKEYLLKEVLDNNANFILLLDRIQDPGNMGTIIRTADSAGVDAIILLKGCVDIYNSKVIRSTMGSIFNIPIIEADNENYTIEILKENKFNIISSYLNTDNYYHNVVDYGNKVVLVIGNEANGINDNIINKSDLLVKIPIYGKSESLNAAIASGILMYQIKNNLPCK